MKIGVFDHFDSDGRTLAAQYAWRLELVEAYDRSGIDIYHLAEHHSTALGLAPSPSVFLSAVAQRTKRLRFGPLVYTLPLHYPLRLFEEICMLDQMSGGRLELGIGRGISPFESSYYGFDPKQAREMYAEVFDILLKAFAGWPLDDRGDLSRYGRAIDRARHELCRLAVDRSDEIECRSKGSWRQLSHVAVCLRRYDTRGGAALPRPLHERGAPQPCRVGLGML